MIIVVLFPILHKSLHINCLLYEFVQIGVLGYPDAALNDTQITRSLEAYLMWLFGKVMFTETHVDTISARFINMAREIAEAQQPDEIVPRSFGSAVLAATYRAMCTACRKNKGSSSILGCPMLLHLWSWERFPIGRPDVDALSPWEYRLIETNLVALPTIGSMWARREVNFNITLLLVIQSCLFRLTNLLVYIIAETIRGRAG